MTEKDLDEIERIINEIDERLETIEYCFPEIAEKKIFEPLAEVKKIRGPVGGTQYCNDPVKEITPAERVVKNLVKWNPGKNIIQVQFKRISYDGADYVYRFITRDDGRQIDHRVIMKTGPNDCLIGYYKLFDLYVFCPFGG